MYAQSFSISQSLHEKALKVAASYFKAEAELIDVLQKIDSAKAFRDLGYSSLFTYATQGLKLPENTAYSFILVSRKASQVPELKKEIVNGNLNISNARRIAPILTPENKNEWIEKAKDLPQKKLEKELAKEFPKMATPEKVSYVTETRLQVSLGISEELMKKFKRAQDLVSHNTSKPASLEQTLEKMLEQFLEKNDPLEKAKRAQVRVEKNTEAKTQIPTANKVEKPNSKPDSITKDPKLGARQEKLESSARLSKSAAVGGQRQIDGQSSDKNTRKSLPASTRHAIALRDRGQCTFQFSRSTGTVELRSPSRPAAHIDIKGSRCEETRWIHTHHLTPVSYGGDNSLSNLTTLCSFHHAQVHQMDLF